MLGNLDVDAGDDTWTLSMKDQEIASGGRYDRLSFTVSKGQLTSVVSENALDLISLHHSAPYPLAAFDGLITSDQLNTMTNTPLDTNFFHRVFNDKHTSFLTHSDDSLSSHPSEVTGLLVGSVLVGMMIMFGVMKFLSPSSSSTAAAAAASPDDVILSDDDVKTSLSERGGGGGGMVAPRVELEKTFQRNSGNELIIL
jgi:hypothetical protein